MKRIVITGIRGGVGATTVAANLTMAFHSIDQQAHAIDANPANLMRLHFCMEPSNTDGWIVRKLDGETWQQAGYQNSRQIAFVPFGQVSDDQYQLALADLQQHPRTLVESFTLPNASMKVKENWQIILLPEVSSLDSFHFPLLEEADLVVCVTRTDIQSYLSLQQGRHYQNLLKMCQPRLLINGFQPASPISRDMQLVMQNEYERTLIPVLMHDDTAIAESVANLASVLEGAPYSQAAQDYHSLAFWCLSHLNQAQSVSSNV
ncbi:cellulose biosynthesis protein BcsQ [Vibrio rumoiensis]|uniref:Cellulose synthase operon protein YhjQ n=1 Tax=Vibrio rumoiensis 1S-45 TaxID=1188252 RepID=A0A1E5E3W0_9VIBR|nr:cellulose biosynthesis protein BcsQ [Vibrio rumoiensis]OEF27265.1 cellulose synthase operon protein YhjQ [Vibrio rumoiensis 1S-45]